jgi:hypothetical protein
MRILQGPAAVCSPDQRAVGLRHKPASPHATNCGQRPWLHLFASHRKIKKREASEFARHKMEPNVPCVDRTRFEAFVQKREGERHVTDYFANRVALGSRTRVAA